MNKRDAVKEGSTWFSRLMDRRAAKGGKLVLWWRERFGKLTPEQLERIVDETIDAAKKARRK
jgi:hypothetical protein